MAVLHDDPYTLLGVSRTASEDEIRAAFRKLAKKNHPDLNPGDTAAEDRFKKVNAAYGIVGDPEKRARYDRGEIGPDGAERAAAGQGFGQGGFGQGGFGQGGFGQGGFRGDTRQEGPFTFRWSPAGGGRGPEGFEGEDISSIFSDLFGRAAGAEAHTGRQANFGEDVRYRLTVSFEDAAKGARKRVNLADGSTIDVTLPPGVETGHVLRLRGKGRQGGDALVEVEIAPHPAFTRKGLDIHTDLPITLEEAVLGGRVPVETVHGGVTLTVPRHANSGQVLRLRGKGIKKGERSGDHYVRLLITLPDGPDKELETFVRGWAKRSRKPAGR